ncbi:MAG: hypothetical protein ACJASJ_001467, partial [Candidatus Azotimanducaceae bacterium]
AVDLASSEMGFGTGFERNLEVATVLR